MTDSHYISLCKTHKQWSLQNISNHRIKSVDSTRKLQWNTMEEACPCITDVQDTAVVGRKKKRQHSDGLVCFSCRRDPFQFHICPKERTADWLLSHVIARMGQYFSVIYLYVAKPICSEVTRRGEGEYPKK